MIRPPILFALLAMSCSAPPEKSGGSIRIVSLDYCADQYVLGLADRENIAALSNDATADYAYYRDEAVGLPQTSDRAEDVLSYSPTVVVRTYGGGPDAAALYQRLGIETVQIGYASKLADIPTVVEQAASDLDAEAKGRVLIDEMQSRLDKLASMQTDQTVLYFTQGGVTAGPATLIDEIITKAGFRNFQTTPGWQPLPLEKMAHIPPDIIATGFYDGAYTITSPWSASRHPVAQRQLADRPTIVLDSAVTSCAAWYVVDAIEALVGAKEAE